MSVWAWLAAPFIGLTLALFGAGGGMTTVPLLTYGLHMPLKSAIASSLWIVAAVSLTSLLRQRAWRRMNIRLLVWLAIGGIAGSWLGTRIGLAISDMLQGAIFGSLTWFVAWWMKKPKSQATHAPEHRRHYIQTLIAGLLLGIVTGILGVGGGFLMVPILIWLGISDYKLAVAHSLLLITVNATVAGLGYIGAVQVHVAPLLMIAVLAMAGSLAGSFMLKRWSSEHLQSAFSLLLILIGGFMLMGAARAWLGTA